MESHLNLALCGLETTQNQVKDQSKQIERLTSKITEQSKQIASLMSTVQGLVQQVELKKLWCCVEGGSKISWFYQLS